VRSPLQVNDRKFPKGEPSGFSASERRTSLKIAAPNEHADNTIAMSLQLISIPFLPPAASAPSPIASTELHDVNVRARTQPGTVVSESLGHTLMSRCGRAGSSVRFPLFDQSYDQTDHRQCHYAPIKVKTRFIASEEEDAQEEPAADNQADDSESKPAVRRHTKEPPQT